MITSTSGNRATSRPPFHNKTNFIENSLKVESKSFIDNADTSMIKGHRLKIGTYLNLTKQDSFDSKQDQNTKI